MYPHEHTHKYVQAHEHTHKHVHTSSLLLGLPNRMNFNFELPNKPQVEQGCLTSQQTYKGKQKKEVEGQRISDIFIQVLEFSYTGSCSIPWASHSLELMNFPMCGSWSWVVVVLNYLCIHHVSCVYLPGYICTSCIRVSMEARRRCWIPPKRVTNP